MVVLIARASEPAVPPLKTPHAVRSVVVSGSEIWKNWWPSSAAVRALPAGDALKAASASAVALARAASSRSRARAALTSALAFWRSGSLLRMPTHVHLLFSRAQNTARRSLAGFCPDTGLLNRGKRLHVPDSWKPGRGNRRGAGTDRLTSMICPCCFDPLASASDLLVPVAPQRTETSAVTAAAGSSHAR